MSELRVGVSVYYLITDFSYAFCARPSLSLYILSDVTSYVRYLFFFQIIILGHNFGGKNVMTFTENLGSAV